jgi:hypothetical protein
MIWKDTWKGVSSEVVDVVKTDVGSPVASCRPYDITPNGGAESAGVRMHRSVSYTVVGFCGAEDEALGNIE